MGGADVQDVAAEFYEGMKARVGKHTRIYVVFLALVVSGGAVVFVSLINRSPHVWKRVNSGILYNFDQCSECALYKARDGKLLVVVDTGISSEIYVVFPREINVAAYNSEGVIEFPGYIYKNLGRGSVVFLNPNRLERYKKMEMSQNSLEFETLHGHVKVLWQQLEYPLNK